MFKSPYDFLAVVVSVFGERTISSLLNTII